MVKETDTAAGWGAGAHPLLAAVETMTGVLEGAVTARRDGTDPAWLDAKDQGRYLEGLARARQRLDTLMIDALDTLDVPDGVASLTGARSPADWLAHRLRLRPARLFGEARLGAAVAARPALSAGMAAGAVSVDHSRAVIDSLELLPADLVDATTLARAEQTLVGYCTDFTPPQVRRLGREILTTVAPDRADAIESAQLERAEREAYRRTRLRQRPIGDGLVRVTADLPTLHASILDLVLTAIANPRRDHLRSTDTATDDQADPAGTVGDDGQRIPRDQRIGQAFCTLLEHVATTPTAQGKGLPVHGGTPVAINVIIDAEKLFSDLDAACLLDTGGRISVGEARRLACGHGVLPAVLGGVSEVLDLGRQHRLYTAAQRRALALAHHECQAAGCTIPAAWCQAHHRQPWSLGGPTDLDHGALLCSHHHRRAHDSRYQTHWSADGVATFSRRC